MLQRKSIFVMVTLIVLLVAGFATLSANAQSGDPATPPATPAAPTGPGGRRGAAMAANTAAFQALLACGNTNYDDVVAKALGITAADLRVALVSGKSLQDLAKEKNVSADTVRSATTDALKAQVAQAVKDGVITQAQADFITGLLNRIPAASANPANPPATPPAEGTPEANGNRPNRVRPGAFPAGIGLLGGFGISPRVEVKNYVVAAQAINIPCADLITAVQGRQSIAQVAQSKNVTAQTVIDALVKAHNDALDEEVKEGLITSAQKDGQAARLTAQMTAFVNGQRTAAFAPFPAQPGQQSPSTLPGLRGRLGGLACQFFGIACGRQGNGPRPGGNATPMPTQSS